jgi:hypothetical protein
MMGSDLLGSCAFEGMYGRDVAAVVKRCKAFVKKL